MGRQRRPSVDGLVYHALKRGDNRGAVFTDAGDFQALLDALAAWPAAKTGGAMN